MKLSRILESALYVDDLEAAEEFYRDVLGLEVMGKEKGRHVFFRCADAVLLIFDPASTSKSTVTTGESDVPLHGPPPGDGHLAWAVAPRYLDAWRRKLEQHGVDIESEVTWPDGTRSVYFRDPAGNCLEFAPPSLWGFPDA